MYKTDLELFCTMLNSRTHNMIQKEAEEVETFLDKTLIEELGCSRSQDQHCQANYKHKTHINIHDTPVQNTETMPDLRLKVPFAK